MFFFGKCWFLFFFLSCFVCFSSIRVLSPFFLLALSISYSFWFSISFLSLYVFLLVSFYLSFVLSFFLSFYLSFFFLSFLFSFFLCSFYLLSFFLYLPLFNRSKSTRKNAAIRVYFRVFLSLSLFLSFSLFLSAANGVIPVRVWHEQVLSSNCFIILLLKCCLQF